MEITSTTQQVSKRSDPPSSDEIRQRYLAHKNKSLKVEDRVSLQSKEDPKAIKESEVSSQAESKKVEPKKELSDEEAKAAAAEMGREKLKGVLQSGSFHFNSKERDVLAKILGPSA